MKYFKPEELYRSRTADQKGIYNVPPLGAKKCLERLVDNILDPLREHLGVPIIITSGYRSPELNRAVGGAKNSQHCLGQAVDFKCHKTEDLVRAFNYIKDSLPFDQLIWEHGTREAPDWIHVSYRMVQRRGQVLRLGIKR